MDIDEAIKILAILESRSINHSLMFKKDALGLGIEALKAIKEWRDHLGSLGYLPLPGETPAENKVPSTYNPIPHLSHKGGT